MHSYRLVLEGTPDNAEWALDWDNTTFTLKDPDGQSVLETQSHVAHRLLDVFQLFSSSRIRITANVGLLAFKKNKAAVEDLRTFLENALRSDSDYRRDLHQQAVRAIVRGSATIGIAGTLFAVGCFLAVWGDKQLPREWLEWVARWFGWMIYGTFLLLIGVCIRGAYQGDSGLSVWFRIGAIERSIAGFTTAAEMPRG